MTHDITDHGGDRITVTGHLAANAVHVASAGKDPSFFVMVDIEPSKGMPYHAMQAFGPGQEADYAAGELANKLKRGDLVQVTARGLRVKTDHGRATLVLMDVIDISPFVPNQAKAKAVTQEA